MKETITEIRLRNILGKVSKLFVPSGTTATFHIECCDKIEMMDLANKLNTKIVVPENNIYADRCSIRVQAPNPYSSDIIILVHSGIQSRADHKRSDINKMIAFAEDLSLITGPEIEDKNLREHLEVVLHTIHTSTEWLKTEIVRLQNKVA